MYTLRPIAIVIAVWPLLSALYTQSTVSITELELMTMSSEIYHSRTSEILTAQWPALEVEEVL